MKKKSASQSAFFYLRVLLAFTLCSVGALLAMLSLGATPPVETTRANTSVPPDPANFPSTFGSNANRLPPGVPLPPGAQFSLNRQGDPSSSSPTAGFPGFAGMPQIGDWSIVSSPNTSATQNNDLFGVACVSASDCWAVGDYSNDNSIPRTLIEHWDGTSWAIVSSPNTGTTDRNFLTGVTCASASECWAVGYYYNGNIQTLIVRWDGTSWAIVSSPNPAPNSYLNDVTCVSASDCWAVGPYYNGSAYQTLIERWDGTSWAIVSSPNPGENNYLKGVTCVSASECWAVGFYYTGILPVQTLIERWDGTSWAIVASPNTSATQSNELFPVTCVSASECWAVGNYYNGSALSDPDRALGRDLVGHRHLAQHQRYAGKRPLWRDVRVGVGVLGRRLLLHRQLHSSDPDRALGRDLVGHRQLAQHQHYAGQLPPSREMRVGVGVLGRWRLLRQLRHRPDASVEVHGEPSTDTDSYTYGHAYSNTDPNVDSDSYTVATAYSDTETTSDSAPPAIVAKLNHVLV